MRKVTMARRLALGVALLATLAGLPLAGPGPAGRALATEAPKNILVIMTDDQTLEMLSAMPALTGRTDMITFDRAYENVPLCCPSRATLLTGQYSHHTNVEFNSDGLESGKALDETSTLATWLNGEGYVTGLFGKYLNMYPWDRGNYIPPGWDKWSVFHKDAVTTNPDQEYYTYKLVQDDNTPNPATVARPGVATTYASTADEYYSTDLLARRVNRFIERAGPDPFFALYSPPAPHEPWVPATRHQSVPVVLPADKDSIAEATEPGGVADKPAWVQAIPAPTAAQQLQHRLDRKKAYRTLMAVDEAIDSFFATLVATGKDDTTVVMFLTDNGYSFGEHRVTQKRCVYEECVRTPLLVRYPGVTSPRSEQRLVQTMDLAPTIAALAQAMPTLSQDGTSLVPLLQDDPPPTWRDSVLLRYKGVPPTGTPPPGFWAIVTEDGWKYSELATGEVELYNLQADEFELSNLADDPASQSQRQALASRLAAKKAEAGVP